MPRAAKRPCSKPGCGRLTEAGAYCDQHAGAAKAVAEAARPSAAKRGYGRKWQAAREAFLADHPTCEMECEAAGIVTPATVVDHIKPHKGDQKLFWSRSNWQAGCKPCHDRKTAREDGGFGRKPTRG